MSCKISFFTQKNICWSSFCVLFFEVKSKNEPIAISSYVDFINVPKSLTQTYIFQNKCYFSIFFPLFLAMWKKCSIIRILLLLHSMCSQFLSKLFLNVTMKKVLNHQNIITIIFHVFSSFNKIIFQCDKLLIEWVPYISKHTERKNDVNVTLPSKISLRN